MATCTWLDDFVPIDDVPVMGNRGDVITSTFILGCVEMIRCINNGKHMSGDWKMANQMFGGEWTTAAGQVTTVKYRKGLPDGCSELSVAERGEMIVLLQM